MAASVEQTAHATPVLASELAEQKLEAEMNLNYN